MAGQVKFADVLAEFARQGEQDAETDRMRRLRWAIEDRRRKKEEEEEKKKKINQARVDKTAKAEQKEVKVVKAKVEQKEVTVGTAEVKVVEAEVKVAKSE